MTTTHKPLPRIIAACVLAFLLLPLTAKAQKDDPATAIAPEAALEKLLAGNARFMKGMTLEKHYRADRPNLAKGEHPYAIILTCADSRLSPEAIFDESLGQLFVVRVAGNVSDPIILGSIEYAAEQLPAPLLVVMGHESCGTIKAAVANSPVPPNIAKIIQRLHPAVDKARGYSRNESEIVAAAIKENVRYQVKMMTFESDVLGEMVHAHKLKIMGGVYNLQTGKVDFMPEGENETAPLAKAEEQRDAKPSAALTSSVPMIKSSLLPKPTEKKPTAPALSVPAKKAAPAKAITHSTHDDAEEETALNIPPPETKPIAQPAFAFADLSFASKVRAVYENNYQVVLKRNALLRDSHDRCIAADCRSLPAGEIVTLDSPYLLEVMGRPNLRVRYGRRTFYIPAEENNFVFSTDVWEPRYNLMGQLVNASTKVMNAFSLTRQH